jgi:hypothetical protein
MSPFLKMELFPLSNAGKEMCFLIWACKKQLVVRPLDSGQNWICKILSFYPMMETDPGEIFGCHSVTADSCLWECDTLLLGKWFLVFWRIIMPSYSGSGSFFWVGLTPTWKHWNCASYNLVSHPRRLDSSQTDGISETLCFKKIQQWAVSKIMLSFVACVTVLK